MSRLTSIVAVFAIILLSKNEAARILAVFPTPSISHQVVFRSLTQALAQRGHKVTVITPDPVLPKGQAPENLTEIDVHDISYKSWRKELENINNGEKGDINRQASDLLLTCLKIFEEQTTLFEVQDIITKQNHNFDLILVEAWTRFALGFSHAIPVPVIVVSSFIATFDNYDVIGAPNILYQVNTPLYNLSPWKKIMEYHRLSSIIYTYKSNEVRENACVKRIFGQETPALSKLQNNIRMLFLNVCPIWEGIRPVPPGVVHMGGLHQKPQNPLPEDLNKYLDSSVNGVIYISFGTNVNPTMLPPEKIQTIVQAVSKLPYNVLWKWDHGELPGRTKNIETSKWFPQADLLRHPKIKLFITQGGLQSTDEAITAGVPLIGIPMLGDQYENVEKYVHHKIGMYLELATLEVQSLRSAIETVIGDKSYRENVVRLSRLMEDQPMSPLERAVWWTEHVLRHGGASHFRSPAANMPWTVYYEIDLVLAVLVALLSVIVLNVLVVYKVVKCISKNYMKNEKFKTF